MSTDNILTREGLLDFKSNMKQVNLDFKARQKQQELVNNQLLDPMRARQEADRLRNEAAWTIDADLMLASGQAKQQAAAVVEGGARTLGNIASLPLNIQGAALAGIPDETMAAYEMVQQYEAVPDQPMTPEVQQAYNLLDTVVQEDISDIPVGGTAGMAMNLGFTGEETNRDRIERAINSMSAGEKISAAFQEPVEGITNPLDKEEVNRVIAEKYDTGVATFREGTEKYRDGDFTGAALDMLKGAGELVSGFSALVDEPTVVATYVSENLPELLAGAASKTALAMQSAGYSADIFREGVKEFEEREGRLPNQAEVVTILGVSTTAGAVDLVADKALIDSVTSPAKGAVKEIASSTVKEGATEAYQTLVEENLSSLDTDIEGRDIFTAAVIGAAVGGTISTAGQAGTLVKSGKDAFNAAKETTKASQKTNAEVTTAAESGDFTTVKENPVSYVDALIKRNETAPIEEVKTNYGEITTTYKTQLQKAEEVYSQFEQVSQAKGKDSKEAKNLAKAYNVLVKSNEQMAEKIGVERQKVIDRVKSGDVEAEVTKAVEGDTQAAETVFGSFQLANDVLTADEAVRLASSPALSQAQKTQLNNYAQFQQSVASLGEVNSMVIDGGVDANGQRFIGANEYKNFISSEIAAGNETGARETLKGLEVFAKRHEIKADLAQKAVEGGVGSPAYQQYESVYGKKMNSPKLASIIKQEADLLNLAVTQERANIDSAFTQSPDTTTKGEQAVNQTEQEAPTAQTGPDALTELEAENDAIEAQREAEIAQRQEDFEALQQEATPEAPQEVVEPEVVQSVTEVPETVQEASQEEEVGNAATEETPFRVPVGAQADLRNQIAAANRKITELGSDAGREDVLTKLQQEPQAAIESREKALENVKGKGKRALLNREIAFLKAYVDRNNPIPKAVVDSEVATETRKLVNRIKRLNQMLQGKLPPRTYNVLGELTNDETKPLDEQNLVKAFFTKRPEANVLNSVGDFTTDVYVGSDTYVKAFGDANPEVQFASFMDLRDNLENSLTEVFEVKTREKFRYEDFTQFLTDEQGNLLPQVVTAITAGVYNWITSDAKSSLVNDRSAINSILGRDQDSFVEPKEYQKFGQVGVLSHVVNERIGKDIANTLQLTGKDNAPSYVDNKLAMSLGQLATGAMINAGYLDKNFVKADDIGTDVTGQGATVAFYRAKGTKGDSPTLDSNLLDIVDVNKGYNQLTKKLFDIDRSRPFPSFEVPTSVVKKMKRTFQNVPQEVQDILKKHQERKHFIKPQELNVFRFLGLQGQREINGYVADKNSLMKVTHDSIEGKNSNIDREIDDLNTFLESMDDESQPFYFTHEIWKNMRVGMVGAVNPQSSKIHRHLIAMDGWEQEVSLDNQELVKQFKLAVAEGMDIGTDKLTQEVALQKFEDTMNQQDVMDGVRAIQAVLNDTYESVEDTQQAIIKAVKAGGMKTHSLDALVNYARYQNAIDQGKPTFMANLFREVDGVTNGVAIASLQFAVGKTYADRVERLNRMGMFFDNQGDSYGEWKAQQGHLDTYESIVPLWQKSLNTLVQSLQGKERQQLESIIKLVGNASIIDDITEGLSVSKDERGETKYPLMVLIYGSSDASVERAVGEAFVENVYKKIQKAIDSGDAQLLKQVLDTVNTLSGSNYKVKGSRYDYLGFELTKAETNRIINRVSDLYGKPLTGSINQNFAEFTEQRKLVNGAARLAFESFNAMYEAEIDKAIEAKKASGEWVDGISDLTKQERERIRDGLKKSMPIIDNYFSLKTGDVSDGIYTGKLDSERQYGKQGNPYFVNTKFAKKIAGAERSTTYGSEVVYKDPGVSPTVLGIQSMDAATMLLTYGDSNVLGIHDAIGIGVNDVSDYAENINRNFKEVMDKQSLLSQAIKMYQRSMRELAKYDQVTGSNLMDTVGSKAYGTLAGIVGKDNVPYNNRDKLLAFQQIMLAQAKNTVTNKKELLERVTSVLQYNVEGGSYKPEVTATNNPTEEVQAVYDNASNAPKSVDELKATLGSTYQDVIDQFEFDTPLRVSQMNAEAVFDNLLGKGTVTDSQEHTAHLRGILTGTVEKVLKPFNLYLADSDATETIGVTTLADMYIVNQANGVQPQSGSLAHGLRMSSTEVYVHELVHNITYHGLRKRPALRREVRKIWEASKAVLTPQDFMNGNLQEGDAGYQEELDAATERYNYIFDRTKNENYLDEFVALGTTNANIIRALGTVRPEVREERNLTFAEKLNNVLMKLLDLVYELMTGTYGKTADRQLQQLMSALANVDARKKQGIIRAYEDTMEVANNKVNDAFQYARDQVSKLAESDFIKKSKYSAIRAGGAAVRIVGKDNIDVFADTVEKFSNNITQSTDGLAGAVHSVYVEGAGRTQKNGVFHDIKRIGNAQIDQLRKRTMQVLKGTINDAFTKELSQEDKRTITNVIRTDMTTLVDSLGVNSTLDLLRNDGLLEQRIESLEKRIQEQFGSNGMFYTNHAHNLGHFMVTERSLLPSGVLKNAHNIARLRGSNQPTPDNASQAEPMIDVLASMYALKYLGKRTRGDLAMLMVDESNGMNFVINMHKGFKKDSAKELSPAHMVKGYMADMVNHEISFRVGTIDDQAEFEAQGYIKGAKLAKDPTDAEKTETFIYVAKDGGMAMYNAGIVNLATSKARGSSLYDVRMNASDNSPAASAIQDLQTVSPKKVAEFDKTFGKVTFKAGNYTSPVFNPDGGITGWNYLMSSVTKDDYLERDTRIDEVFPKMVADLKVKPNIRENNNTFVEAMYEQFKEDGSVNPNNYVEIHARSSNPRYREIWNMLPDEMKRHTRKVWGRNSMMVSKDMLDLAFGYRKYSMTEIINKDPESRNYFEKLVGYFVTRWFGADAARRIRKAENVIQELVSMGKDIWVIKSFFVTLANTMSNVVLLSMKGVSMKDIFYGYSVAFKGASDYKKQVRELEEVEEQLNFATLTNRQRNKLADKAAFLRAELNANPVKDLIDNGALQTIVEDVDLDNEENTVKGALEEFGDKMTSRVPKPIKDAARVALLMQGTKPYTFLRDAAQLSDFGARYVLFNELRQGEKQMNVKDAVGEVMDVFIDYDLPTHKMLQYGNDMGFLFFTKYLIRVIKIMYTTMRENTARVLSILLLQNWFGNVTDIYDTGLNPLSRIGTPLDFVDSPTDIATIQAVM